MNKNELFRFIKFSFVGGSGVLINQGFLTLLSFTHLTLAIRSPLAIEIAIISNFLLNNYWTWKEKKINSTAELANRFLKFNLTSGIVAIIFNYIPLLLLVKYGGWREPFANLTGIALGTLVNYFINHFWIFLDKE